MVFFDLVIAARDVRRQNILARTDEHLLIDITIDILHAVKLVDVTFHLVGVPCQVNVQCWHEERARRRAHQVQESTSSHIQQNNFA